MDLMRISKKESMSREAAAALRHSLADELARNNEAEVDREGLRIQVHVPDEVQLKVEVEIGDERGELEVELTW